MAAWPYNLRRHRGAGERPTVLLVDITGNYARDVVRCLALAGHGTSHVLAPATCIARHSRFAILHAQTGAADEDDWLLTSVARLRSETQARILLPVDEGAAAFVDRNRGALAHDWLIAPSPSLASLDVVRDKARFARYLAAHDLPHPPSELATTVREAHEAAARLGYPVLLKPILDSGNGVGIRRCNDERQLNAALAEGALAQPMLVQTFLSGSDEDCSVICANGRVLAHTVQRPALPPARAYSAAQALYFSQDSEALDIVARLMASLNYDGVAHVDMRRARIDGKLRIIEVNPRFWQTMMGSLCAGVNFPDLICRHACGEDLGARTFRKITFVPWRLLLAAWAKGQPLGLRRPWQLRTGIRYVIADPGVVIRTSKTQEKETRLPRVADGGRQRAREASGVVRMRLQKNGRRRQ